MLCYFKLCYAMLIIKQQTHQKSIGYMQGRQINLPIAINTLKNQMREDSATIPLRNHAVFLKNRSQLKELMSDQLIVGSSHDKFEIVSQRGAGCNSQTISHTHKEYHPGFVEIAKNKKAFLKPYEECAKYMDLVSKNKVLVRRGAFDIPAEDTMPKTVEGRNKMLRMQKIHTDRSQSKLSNYKDTLNSRSISHISHINAKTQRSLTKPALPKKNSTSQTRTTSLIKFDRSLPRHMLTYREMMQLEREPFQEILLKNSVNRLLAAEMIRGKMKLSKDRVLTTKNLRL